MSERLRRALEPYSEAVITGGSSGIGAGLCAALLTLKSDLRLCNLSRRNPPSFSTSENRLFHHPVNLADGEALAAAASAVESWLGLAFGGGKLLLINNAGFGSYGPFEVQEAERQTAMVDVNARAVVDLTHRLLPALKARGGTIVNVASTAAFQPLPGMATYAATKAFLLHWSVALDAELRPHGVRSIALCPGPTETDFFKAAGLRKATSAEENIPFSQSVDDVVATTLKALARGKPIAVSGLSNKLTAFLGARVPKTWAAAIGARLMRRLRLDGRRA